MYLIPLVATGLIFFICVSNNGLEQASAQYYAGGINTREMRMCGPMLTNTLELVCQGRFNTINKKSQGDKYNNSNNQKKILFIVFYFQIPILGLKTGRAMTGTTLPFFLLDLDVTRYRLMWQMHFEEEQEM